MDDDTWRGLAADIRTAAIQELARQFSFVGRRMGQRAVTVAVVKPEAFPASLSFTDAVITLVDTADELAAHVNDAITRQGRTAVAALAGNGVPYKRPAEHIQYQPERGGLTSRVREIIPTRGGVFALYIVSSAVVLEGVAEQVSDYLGSLIHLEKAKRRRQSSFSDPQAATYWMTAKASRRPRRSPFSRETSHPRNGQRIETCWASRSAV